ncbi:MAG TPA: spiro-SPASM protein, partial [Turneriella sp.]|nr:spiro-SPASM protein [Turneriella sp.]
RTAQTRRSGHPLRKLQRIMAFENDTVFLIHFNDVYRKKIQEDTLSPLLALFAGKLNAFNAPVYLCTPDGGAADKIATHLPGAEKLNLQSEIRTVRHLFSTTKATHIGIFNGAYPLFDKSLTQKIFQLHSEYRADISYGENLPAGMAPYFVSRDLLESLDIIEAKDEEWQENGIRAFVEKNINQFHAEVHYEEPDLRLLRLDFSLSTKRSVQKAKAFLEKILDKENPYHELQHLIDGAPQLLATFPSYIELEFNSQSEHLSFFSPLKYIEQEKHLLSRENFARVKNYIATGLGDTSVCASGLGEPLEHPDALYFIEELLGDNNIPYVFIETNGVRLDALFSLAAHPHADKLRAIVFLNSLEKYAEYSGAPANTLEKVKNNVRAFVIKLREAKRNPQEILYIQALKVEENETEIDALYALTEELGATFLFQKYNRYAGLMPERRVSDMTPLERYSCWHLRRDIFIRANGDVAYCKQTIDQKKNTARGNLANDDLIDLWNAQRDDFEKNYKGDYPPHLPCATCDEYFTFNF